MKMSAGSVVSLTLATLMAFSAPTAMAGGNNISHHNGSQAVPSAPVTASGGTGVGVGIGGQGGTGGQGGMGGQGGIGGEAQGGNGFGGQGGSTGPITMSNNFKAPLPTVSPGFGFAMANGECGKAKYFNLGTVYVGGGYGFSERDENSKCPEEQNGRFVMNLGYMHGDPVAIAQGSRVLQGIYPSFKKAIDEAVENIMQPCAAKAIKISPLVLASDRFTCDPQGRPALKQVEVPATQQMEPKAVNGGHDLTLNP